MRRRLLVLGAFLAVLAMAGCFGPAEIPEDQLNENATYDWDADADAAYDLSRSSYTAVFDLKNQSTLRVYDRDALGVETPVDLRGLRFRFQNGTVVNASHANLSAALQQRRTEISVPAADGRVGYTAARSGKQFSTPVVVPGRQQVTMRPGARVGLPLLSQVQPGNYTTSVTDNQMTITWGNVTDTTLRVQFYLQRDVLLFSVLLLIAVTIGGGGLIYYLRQIRQLESQREEIGLDVDTEDDDLDDGPPPGMR
jgi:hypothetical protein